MSGFSSEPLLEACRKLQRIGVPPPEEVGLFRPDYQNWDLKTTVGYGASHREAIRIRSIASFARMLSIRQSVQNGQFLCRLA